MKILAWIAITITCLFSCFWAFWGIIENFHEGWYYESFLMNVGMMLVQYLLFSLIFIALGTVALRWRKFGAILFILSGILIPLFGLEKQCCNFYFFITSYHHRYFILVW